MHWFDLKVWATCALALSACSDDGVPLDAGTEGVTSGPSATAGESDTANGGTSSAVTTADPGTLSDTADTSDPTDPTGTTDTEGGSSTDPGSTGSDGSTGTGSESDTDSGDSSGTGTTTGGIDDPECVVDEDCTLVNDCCSCEAVPLGEDPPECDIEACLIPTCTSVGLGKPAVQCNFGTCEVEEVSCDPLLVECDQDPPTCPDGQAPRVVDGCWGACIPVEYCDVVPSCEACGPDEACVEDVTQLGPRLQCVPMPPACEGVPSCDCLGEACEAPLDVCEDGIEPKSGSELSCNCPAC
ncbi:MAG: hypothetical protein ACE37F_25760 [Nannocystaceae bacterium]|nr:hypothetical protein [bacterium]